MSFDDLTPEHFIRETSAVEQRSLPLISQSFYFHLSEDGFETFVGVQRYKLHRQLALAPDEFPTSAVLLSEQMERQFVGEGDEFPHDFATRLRREAAAMNAEYTFVAMTGPLRPDGTPPPVVSDLEALDAGLDSGELEVGLIWLASSRQFGDRDGVIFLDETGKALREVRDVASPDDPFLHLLA